MYWKPPLGTQLNQAHPLSKDLISCWIMNEGSGLYLNDYSGYGNHGTLIADTHWVPGRTGLALNFDGTGDYVNIAENNGLPIYSGSSPYSISFWVKGISEQNAKRIFAEGRYLSDIPTFNLMTRAFSEYIQLYLRADDATVLLNDVASTAIVFDNTWHYVVWTDNAGNGKLYIDGQQDATDFSYTPNILTLDRTAIGALERGSVTNYFAGQISEVVVWNRVLLISEIQQLYQTSYVMFEQPKKYWVVEVGISMPIVMQQMNQFNGGSIL